MTDEKITTGVCTEPADDMYADLTVEELREQLRHEQRVSRKFRNAAMAKEELAADQAAFVTKVQQHLMPAALRAAVSEGRQLLISNRRWAQDSGFRMAGLNPRDIRNRFTNN